MMKSLTTTPSGSAAGPVGEADGETVGDPEGAELADAEGVGLGRELEGPPPAPQPMRASAKIGVAHLMTTPTVTPSGRLRQLLLN